MRRADRGLSNRVLAAGTSTHTVRTVKRWLMGCRQGPGNKQRVGAPFRQQQGRTATTPKTDTARAEEEGTAPQTKESGAKQSKRQQQGPQRPCRDTDGLRHPTRFPRWGPCFPRNRSTASGLAGGPLKAPVSQPVTPGVGTGSSLSRGQRQMQELLRETPGYPAFL